MNVSDYHRLVDYLNAPGAKSPRDQPASEFVRQRVVFPPDMSVSESLEYVGVVSTLDKDAGWKRAHYNPAGDGWCIELLKSRAVWSARTREAWDRGWMKAKPANDD